MCVLHPPVILYRYRTQLICRFIISINNNHSCYWIYLNKGHSKLIGTRHTHKNTDCILIQCENSGFDYLNFSFTWRCEIDCVCSYMIYDALHHTLTNVSMCVAQWPTSKTAIDNTLDLMQRPISSRRQHVWAHPETAARTLALTLGVRKCGYDEL